MKITKEEIINSPHTKEQLAIWGVPWPPPRGWRKMLLLKGEFQIRELYDSQKERLEMKKLYQRKSGDYSY